MRYSKALKWVKFCQCQWRYWMVLSRMAWLILSKWPLRTWRISQVLLQVWTFQHITLVAFWVGMALEKATSFPKNLGLSHHTHSPLHPSSLPPSLPVSLSPSRPHSLLCSLSPSLLPPSFPPCFPRSSSLSHSTPSFVLSFPPSSLLYSLSPPRLLTPLPSWCWLCQHIIHSRV